MVVDLEDMRQPEADAGSEHAWWMLISDSRNIPAMASSRLLTTVA